MEFTETVLNFKPKVLENYIVYNRRENSVKYLNKTRYENNTEKVVNQTFMEYLALFNGNYTIRDIINIKTREYGIDSEAIKRDLLFVINKLINLQLLGGEDNPFIIVSSKRINQELVLQNVTYNQIRSVKKAFLHKGIECSYINPYQYTSIFQGLVLMRQGNSKNNIIQKVVNNKNEIICLLGWNMRDDNKVVLDSIYVYNKTGRTLIKEIVQNAVTAIREVIPDSNTIEIVINNVLNCNKWLIIALENLQFENIALLCDEFSDDKKVEVWVAYL